ncbi:hypothetical protein NF556_07990 [Ornithinimicrobium faecis]|uniref:Uncharacterized protein n=1 Tax=Ornithinimicrobium faecis TaxID=2934158 RepID=A0ABY4YYG6_9MICO|nr:hypothetical protein [Ornithinimicrobium sp. HY1793]USQ81574.1 hypothetical protein NF556_07990 [Ornithinimicrobium sp. HY1793]
MTDDINNDREDLLALGAEISGATAGTAAGLFIGGPAGALAGAAIGPAAAEGLRWAIAEVGDRVLGRRGRQRAMSAAIYAGQHLEELRSQGAELRSDGFFERQDEGLSSSEEMAEGVLLAAQGSFEEHKIRHIGYLYANTAVDDGIDRYLAGMALKRAGEMTWRQYVLLAMVGSRNEIDLPQGELSDDPGAWSAWGALSELRDLFNARYIHAGQERTDRFGLPFPGQQLTELRLTTQGQLLHHLLSLKLIPPSEVLQVRDLLGTRTNRE